MNIIEIRDLTFAYPGAEKNTLNNVNLEIEKGDFVAIVGNNGCGKSTLCKTINGLIPHFITGNYSGSAVVDGIEVQHSDIGMLAQKVGYVYQDFENQIIRPTVLDDASYACMNYAMSDYIERGRKALEKCGLKGRENDYIWQLSGGQTHLLALSGVVSLEPEVLILDEPIAQLDPYHADLIYKILQDLNEKYGKTIVVIEHHTEYIAEYCKHVVLMKDGHVEWKEAAKEALSRVEELKACNIFPPQVTLAAYEMVNRNIMTNPAILPSTMEDGIRMMRNLVYNQSQNKENPLNSGLDKMVQFQDVSVSYRSVKEKKVQVFDGLNLDIHRGEKIALIGSNGAGKSTMMKLMTGVIKPSEGEVLLKGRTMKNMKPEQLSKYVSLVYQNPEDMFIKDSIESDISFAMKVRNEENWEDRTKTLLERFHLLEYKDRDGRLLSGGQMRRASLAIGIALNPEILLLDEPTANLDIATRKEIMRTLNDIKDVTETVIIATHDMQLVCEWAERIIVLSQGNVIADGTRDEIFGNQEVVQQSGIRPPEIFTLGQRIQKDAFCYTINEFVQGFGGK